MSPRIVLLWLLLQSLALPAACPEFLPTEPARLTLKHQQQTIQAELTWAAASSAPAELQVLGAADQQLLASIALNHPAFSGSFMAQPLAEDVDLDGLADHLWLVNQQGLIWRAAFSGNQLGTPVLLADLSGLGLQFRYSVSLLRTRLPARLAPAVWQNLEQHLLLLLGRDPLSDQDVLLLLRYSVNPALHTFVQAAELADRTELSEAEQQLTLSAADWRNLLATAGWQMRLNGRLTAPPRVVAGVIYAPLMRPVTDSCEPELAEHQLLAVQLHTAGQIYQSRQLNIPYLADGRLQLQQQVDLSVSLIWANSEQQLTILPVLRRISGDCHHCSEPLQLDARAFIRRLATFKDEQGAF